MRYCVVAAALVAISSAAWSQAEGWNMYEGDDGLMQVFVVSPDGTQLIFKCDKPGKNQIYAIAVSPTRLVAPSRDDQVRDVHLRFDQGAPTTIRWRYRDTTARAVSSSRDTSLPRFLNLLADAKTLEIRFDPLEGKAVVANFSVDGTREAVAMVYESCKDQNPLG